MNKIELLEVVAVTTDLPMQGLVAGEIDTVVEIQPTGG